MLAAAQHLVDPFAGQVDGGVAGDSDIAAVQGLADQCVAEFGGGAKDGVAFGHWVRLGEAGLGSAAHGRQVRLFSKWRACG